MAKIVFDLNKSTLTAKKLVVYTILRMGKNGIKPAGSKFYMTRTEARDAAAVLAYKFPKHVHRVAKTVLVHA